ncbi:MAG: LamB/YcsF family protein [Bacillota bacterium]
MSINNSSVNSLNIDLNADIGESFGVYKLGMDEELINYISSANIACGFHAGDPDVMAKTVSMAVANQVGIGAHPSFSDLQGFGRRKMDLEVEQIKNLVTYQLGALAAFARSRGLNLQHLKPHGALYNLAASNYEIARTIAQAIKEFDQELIFVAMCKSEMYKAGKDLDLRVAGEAFADRAYNQDGTLVSRKISGAVLEDPEIIEERVIRMIKKREVETIEGNIINIQPDTICLHGDNPEAIAIVKKLVSAVKSAGIIIKPLDEII